MNYPGRCTSRHGFLEYRAISKAVKSRTLWAKEIRIWKGRKMSQTLLSSFSPPLTSCLTTEQMRSGYRDRFHWLLVLNNLSLYRCALSESCFCGKISDKKQLRGVGVFCGPGWRVQWVLLNGGSGSLWWQLVTAEVRGERLPAHIQVTRRHRNGSTAVALAFSNTAFEPMRWFSGWVSSCLPSLSYPSTDMPSQTYATCPQRHITKGVPW